MPQPRLAGAVYAAGRAVETLVDGRLNPGPHSIDWDALAHGSGAYFYRLEGEGFSQTRKMMLVK